MPEKHREKVREAIKWLGEFCDGSPLVEVKVPNCENGKGYYSVDVVSKSDRSQIAVECGGSAVSKLNALLGLFNEVWVFPYGLEIPYQWREGIQCCPCCGHIIDDK